MRRENSAVTSREPRGELARAARLARLVHSARAQEKHALVYTPNGVLDMTRKPLTRKTYFAQGFYLRVQAWRKP